MEKVAVVSEANGFVQKIELYGDGTYRVKISEETPCRCPRVYYLNEVAHLGSVIKAGQTIGWYYEDERDE